MIPVEQRFWLRVDREPRDGCWLWTGTGDGRGYGSFYMDGRLQKAHRVAWQFEHGPIPDGQNVCHHCDTPQCVRPSHLFLGTQRDNLLDASAKGRLDRGPKQAYCARGHLRSPENVDKIRRCRLCKREDDRSYRAALSLLDSATEDK